MGGSHAVARLVVIGFGFDNRERIIALVVQDVISAFGLGAAGLAVGYWADPNELRANWQEGKRWTPGWSEDERASGYAGWRKAVQRTLDWVEVS